MDAVFRGDIYMPKMTELRPMRIAKPPHKKALQEELISVMEQMSSAEPGNALIEHLKRKDVDVFWLTCMLHMLQPNHFYFDKTYSRFNKAENKKDPLSRPEDKFTVY